MEETKYEYPKYYNYDYNMNEYYEVSGPEHDHYAYDYKTNSYYEITLNV